MYNCPECNNEMIWRSDEIIKEVVLSQYYCKECKIELNKYVNVD